MKDKGSGASNKTGKTGASRKGTNGQNGSAPTPTAAAPARHSSPSPTPSTNDFALKIATVNGTGSASANGLLMQAIFRLGIPVSGKNIFPSNIQGLPTWYEIRVNERGHVARTGRFQLLVAMNSQTYKKDVDELQPGGYLVYDSSWPLDEALQRADVHFLGIPLAQLCNEKFAGARERMLMKNIAYVGALAALLDIDLGLIETLLQEQYGSKKSLMQSNVQAVELGFRFAKENFECPLPTRLQRMAAPDDYILIDGNTAAALGCVFAGATVGAWYPITPSTSLMDSFRRFCAMYRRDEKSGKNKFLVVQAEDELAAAGVVLGASWAGARAFTPTSGPGISLMNEFIGFAYYAEVPSVFVDVQRVGPSTGMPTRTQQGDLLLCAYASHGDTKHIAVYPADPAECFELAVTAFDLADRFQTPVFFVTDLDIGMNDWRVRKLEWDDSYRPDRGKVLGPEQLERMKTFHRYIDVDEDGITARTLPGVHPKGAFFTRGSGHNRFGAYTEDSDEYADVMERVARKIENARAHVPAARVHSTGAEWGIVAVGSSDAAVREAVELLAARGVKVDYMRIRAFPFGAEVDAFLMAHSCNFVVDQNRDGQLLSLLTLETRVPKDKLVSVRYFGGLPLSAHHVVDKVSEHVGIVTLRPEPK
jgi:2-oxoglutarate/2-oxoacid ferredoxin oxidoreductase subunit alpha